MSRFRTTLLGGNALRRTKTPPAGSGGSGGGGGSSTVNFKAFNNDGLTGTKRAVGFVQFKPADNVQAADLANASVWQGATEVACYIEDMGARHLGTAYPTALLGAHVQVNATFSALSDQPSYTLKIGVPPLVPRLTKSPHSSNIFTQAMSVGVGTDPTKLRLTSTITVHHHLSDTPVRISPQDIDYGFDYYSSANSGPAWPDNTVPVPSSGYNYSGFRLTVDSAGKVRAYRFGATTNGFGNVFPYLNAGAINTNMRPDDNGTLMFALGIADPNFWGAVTNAADEQAIGFVNVYVGPTAAGAVTFGTTALNGTGISTVSADVLPKGIPAASVAPSDVAHLCNSQFHYPTRIVASDAQESAAGGIYATIAAERIMGSQHTWQRGGFGTYYQAGNQTAYNPVMQDWLHYARTAGPRYYRRALMAGYEWFTYIYVGPLQQGEASGDATVAITYYVLCSPSENVNSGADAAKAYCDAARDVLFLHDRQEIVNSGVGGGVEAYSTGRFAMHVMQAAPDFDRYGVVPAAAYTLGSYGTLANDSNNWPQASSFTTGQATGRFYFERMMSRMKTYYKTTQPTTGPTIGPTYSPVLVAQDAGLPRWEAFHGDGNNGYRSGIGPFMQNWWIYWTAKALITFGVPSTTPDAWTLVVQQATYLTEQKISDGSRALFYYNDQPSGEGAFWYAFDDGVNGASYVGIQPPFTRDYILSGIAVGAMEAMYVHTGDVKWKTRADECYAALADNGTLQRNSDVMNMWSTAKAPSEGSLASCSWFLTRQT